MAALRAPVGTTALGSVGDEPHPAAMVTARHRERTRAIIARSSDAGDIGRPQGDSPTRKRPFRRARYIRDTCHELRGAPYAPDTRVRSPVGPKGAYRPESGRTGIGYSVSRLCLRCADMRRLIARGTGHAPGYDPLDAGLAVFPVSRLIFRQGVQLAPVIVAGVAFAPPSCRTVFIVHSVILSLSRIPF